MKLTTTLPSLALLALFALAPARAQVPSILNYQGRVTVGGTNLTTNAALFKFALVDSNGSTVYWRNDGSTAAGEPSSAVSVAVAQGLYSTLLGNTSLANMAAIPAAVFSNADVNLRVWFSAGGTNPFVQVAPDQRLGASGYALRAAVADNIASTNIDGNFAVTGTLTVGQLVGGSGSTASGVFATVSGGLANAASGDGATIGGGLRNTNSGVFATIGGGFQNTNSGRGATIGGGEDNTSSGGGATIAGGLGNTNIGSAATIGGGSANTASGSSSVIGGGQRNTASGSGSVIGGGIVNAASGLSATIGGGDTNIASGSWSVIGGGYNNTARGSFATVPGGVRAFATNIGAFVWSGVDSVDTVSTNGNSFTVRAPGGARFLTTTATNAFVGVVLTNGATSWASLSDSNSKTDFAPIDPRQVLQTLASLPVSSWHYKHDLHRRYIGPMAQDFHAAFGLGSDDKTISTLDSDGVMYAAIQGLVEELKVRDKTIGELKAQNEQLSRKIESIDQRLNSLPPAP